MARAPVVSRDDMQRTAQLVNGVADSLLRLFVTGSPAGKALFSAERLRAARLPAMWVLDALARSLSAGGHESEDDAETHEINPHHLRVCGLLRPNTAESSNQVHA
jgi:hypothetical protein